MTNRNTLVFNRDVSRSVGNSTQVGKATRFEYAKGFTLSRRREPLRKESGEYKF